MRLFVAIIVLLLVPAPAAAQEAGTDRLAAIAWLAGDWGGVGEGQPGTSSSARHAERMHRDHFLRVEGRSVYPVQQSNPRGEIHTQTDIWSFDRRRNALVMRQFDNLGFASTYVQDLAASTNGRIVLVAEQLENVPAGWRARYTFEHPAQNEYRELFELDSGRGFEPYVTNRFLRVEAR